MRDFQVKKGVMGYIVTIGCQVAGFSTKDDLLKAITEYVGDPQKTEHKYYIAPHEIHPGNPYGVSLSEPCETAGVTITSGSYTLSNATTSDIPYATVRDRA